MSRDHYESTDFGPLVDLVYVETTHIENPYDWKSTLNYQWSNRTSTTLLRKEAELRPQYCWSRRGNAIIKLGENRFKKRSKHNNPAKEITWVCNKNDKGCKAKLTTLRDAIIKINNVHKHDGTCSRKVIYVPNHDTTLVTNNDLMS